MSRKFLAVVTVGLWLALLLPGTLTARAIPELWGRVIDEGDLIDPAAEAQIVAELEAVEKATGAQLVVFTIASLEGESIEDYALQVAEKWQLGRREVDDGALLLIARDERRMRIEVGYGLEETLTDATSGRILDNILRPRFRAGDFAGGIAAGVHAMAEQVQGRDLPKEALPSQREKRDRGHRLRPTSVRRFAAQTVGLAALRHRHPTAVCPRQPLVGSSHRSGAHRWLDRLAPPAHPRRQAPTWRRRWWYRLEFSGRLGFRGRWLEFRRWWFL